MITPIPVTNKHTSVPMFPSTGESPPEPVSMGCHSEMLQTRMLEQQTFIVSHLWRLQVQVARVGFWWNLSSWLADSQENTVRTLCLHRAFPLCAHREWVSECTLASLLLLIRTPVPLDQGPTLITSFYLNSLLKDSVSKYSHSECYNFNTWI